jgi:methyltransferase
MTRLVFSFVMAVLALQRVLEVHRSRANENEILKEGGRVHAREQVAVMKAMHVAWFASCLLEVWIWKAEFTLRWAAAGAILALLGQYLRLHAMKQLGPLWTVNIMTKPGERRVRSGLYKWIPHPNYFGVALEIAGFPLLHGALRTALIFSCLNGVFLFWRIRAEERALSLTYGG